MKLLGKFGVSYGEHMSTQRYTGVAQIETLLVRIASRDFTVGIVGMGYVGLPLALAALKSGFRVIGFDIDEARVDLLNRGESGMKHIPSRLLADALLEKRFRPHPISASSANLTLF